MSTVQEIKHRLQVLKPQVLALQDDSHQHVGHAGNTGGGHYSLLIVSDFFRCRSRLDRQRMVKAVLHDLFAEHIHALSIKAASPEEYAGSSQSTAIFDTESDYS